MKRLILDIESSGLLKEMLDFSRTPYKLKANAKLWSVVFRDVESGEVYIRNKEGITREWLQDITKDAKAIIAHNGLKFDFLVLKLFGLWDYTIGYPGEESTLFGKPVEFIDTLILSRLFNPDRFGGHSLESWGERTGEPKTDFRQACINAGIIEKTSPKGAEFLQWSSIMDTYCIQDCKVTAKTLGVLERERLTYDGWEAAIAMENKLADLAIRRESFGFWFDKDLAIRCLEDLGERMHKITESINPILPPRPMIKGELNSVTPPKKQLTIKNEPTSTLLNFVDRVGAHLRNKEGVWVLNHKGDDFILPYHEPLETTTPATIDNLDWVKMHLISLGWEPTEWRERDLTKDAKKQNLPYEKRVKAMTRWVEETLNGKYKKERLEQVGLKESELIPVLSKKLKEDKPVRVPTSPTVRVGVEKDLCPNLVKLGAKVAFAKDFALYLTYKHRKSSIAGGDVEDMDFHEETPNTGFLSMYRDVDGRIPTPAIEIGASSNRYRHIGVCNIPRATSEYGKEMRSLFGSGPNGLQLGYDFSSLENRIQGHYVYKYEHGPELAATLIAEKPNDIHTIKAKELGMERSDVKSLVYAILYGAQPKKISKMLSCSIEKATEIFEAFWESVPALKQLKDSLEAYWEKTGKIHILGIDGRKIMTRSRHSLLNALFQSAGVICAKYVNVLTAQKLENQGYCIDPFQGTPDICEMIAYHDEAQYFISKNIVKFKTFDSEEDGLKFIENWQGAQLGALTEGTKWYVTLPNDLSLNIEQAIKQVEKFLKLNVPLGYEWVVNKTWYGCH